MNTLEFRTCRFCKEMVSDSDLLKYGARHYAHPECLLRAKGVVAFDLLYSWQLKQFPYFVAKKFGLLSELERAVRERQ